LDPTGLPVHADNSSIVNERFTSQDRAEAPGHDEITLIDNASPALIGVEKLPRDPSGIRSRGARLSGTTANILIGKELYYLSADRKLMPPEGPAAP